MKNAIKIIIEKLKASLGLRHRSTQQEYYQICWKVRCSEKSSSERNQYALIHGWWPDLGPYNNKNQDVFQQGLYPHVVDKVMNLKQVNGDEYCT